MGGSGFWADITVGKIRNADNKTINRVKILLVDAIRIFTPFILLPAITNSHCPNDFPLQLITSNGQIFYKTGLSTSLEPCLIKAGYGLMQVGDNISNLHIPLN
jgi:hypothetical protein